MSSQEGLPWGSEWVAVETCRVVENWLFQEAGGEMVKWACDSLGRKRKSFQNVSAGKTEKPKLELVGGEASMQC